MRGVQDGALKRVLTGEVRLMRRSVGSGAKDELLWGDRDLRAIATDARRPQAGFGIPPRRLAIGGGPDVELEDQRVGFEPVADLVLRAEDRPCLGEGKLTQVIVPDRIVQHETAVPVPPAVADARVFFDDQRWYVEMLEARGESHAALAAADDQNLGLVLRPEPRRRAGAGFGPGLAVAHRLVLKPHRTSGAFGFLVAFQLVHRGQQDVAEPVAYRDAPLARGGVGLERDPSRQSVFGGLGRPILPSSTWPGRGETGREHVRDRVASFQRRYVPGETQKITPKSRRLEESRDRPGIVVMERRVETREPGGDPVVHLFPFSHPAARGSRRGPNARG